MPQLSRCVALRSHGGDSTPRAAMKRLYRVAIRASRTRVSTARRGDGAPASPMWDGEESNARNGAVRAARADRERGVHGDRGWGDPLVERARRASLRLRRE